MEGVKIERGNIDNVNEICSLLYEVGNLHSEALPHIFVNGSNIESKDIEDFVTDENRIVYVAEINKQVIGLAIGIIKESYDHPVLVRRKYGWIDAMAVKTEFRNQGIGSILLDSIHSWFLDRDIKTIELNVWEFNETAIKLYEKLGYESIKRIMSIDL